MWYSIMTMWIMLFTVRNALDSKFIIISPLNDVPKEQTSSIDNIFLDYEWICFRYTFIEDRNNYFYYLSCIIFDNEVHLSFVEWVKDYCLDYWRLLKLRSVYPRALVFIMSATAAKNIQAWWKTLVLMELLLFVVTLIGEIWC